MSRGDSLDDAAPQDSAKKPFYEGSTQFKNWRLSAQQLQETRALLNDAAIASIRNAFETDSARRLVSGEVPSNGDLIVRFAARLVL